MLKSLQLRKKKAGAEHLAFLPAALEIVETPPSPTGRMTAYALMTIFSLGLGWACLGKVDIVASAKGKIIPSGRTKVVQPFETGVVRAIRVRDGQFVKAGEKLIELDPTMDNAEAAHYQTDLIAAELDLARLQTELTDGASLASFQPPDGAPPEMVAIQRKFLLDQLAEQQEKLAVIDRQREEKQAELQTAKATVQKLEASLPIFEERLQIRKTLYDHGTESKVSYLELLQPFVEEQHELDVQKSKAEEAKAAIAALDEQRQQTIEEFKRERYGELADAVRKMKGLKDDLLRAQHRSALQVLTAPVDGTVQQLAVHTVGGVVTPAQNLLVIVPADSHLEIEAMVENRDIGFVHAGEEARVKVDAFDFNRYGLIGGKVVSVSPDAIAHDKVSDKNKTEPDAGAENDSSEPPDQQLEYAARVSLDRKQMQVDGRLVDLSPGMAATVEIKTGSRRIISYLLSPVMKQAQQALHER